MSDIPGARRASKGFVPTILALVILSGCSNAPVCDFLDCVSPGRLEKDRVPAHGGVCTPGQGTIPIVGNPNLPSTPSVGVPVVPPPAPSPFGQPSPTIPPPPPPPPR